MTRNRKRQTIDFTLVTNPVGQSMKARHAMRKALKGSDVRSDRQAAFLAGHLCKRLGVEPSQVQLGHGASQLLSIFVQATQPKRVLVATPFSPLYTHLFNQHGVEIHSVPLRKNDGFLLDVEEFTRQWNDVDAAFLCSPHDPTGTRPDEKSLVNLIATSNQLDKTLVIDETLIEFTDCASPIQEAVRSRRVLILRSFSFYHALAGLRLGYAVGNADLIAKLFNLIDPFPVNTVAAAAALASLKDTGYSRRTSEFLIAEQVYLAKKLAQLRGIECFPLPWGCLIRFEPAIPDLADRLSEKGIIAETYLDADANQYVRLPFRSRRLNAWFVRRLGWVLKEQQKYRNPTI